MKNDNDFFGFQHKGEIPGKPTEVEETQEEETTTTEEQEEDKEEEEQEEEDSQESQGQEEENTQEFSFKPVWDELAEAGVISFDPEKTYEDSEEGFQEIIADSVAAKVQEELAAIPEEFRSLVDHFKAGGSLVDWVNKMDPTDYEHADLEDEETQEILVREQYKAQGLKEAAIEKKVTKLKEQGLLDTEAEDARDFLIEKRKEDRLAYEKELQDQRSAALELEKKNNEKLLQDINSLDSLDNVPLTKELKTKLHQHLTVKDSKGLTAFQRNLSNKDGLLAAALKDMLGLGKEHTERKAVTKATSKMREEFTKRTPTKNATGKSVQTDIITKRVPTTGMPWSKN